MTSTAVRMPTPTIQATTRFMPHTVADPRGAPSPSASMDVLAGAARPPVLLQTRPRIPGPRSAAAARQSPRSRLRLSLSHRAVWPNPRQWPSRPRLPFLTTTPSPAPRRFTREPFVLDGEDAATSLAPGSARRGALDDALAELEAGAEVPSVAWRQRWSLLLGLDRLLCAGGAQARRRHRPQRPPGRRALGHADRAAGRGRGAAPTAARRPGPPTRRSPPPAIPGEEDARRGRGRAGGAAGLGRRARRRGRRRPAPGRARGPQRRQALLVRARDRRRQDRRRARLRRGLAHRRRPDPHPPPQPRRPVPRRAARPRLRQAHLPAARARAGPRATAR